MIGNSKSNDMVLKLAKGLCTQHHLPSDIAYNYAFTYVNGRRPQRQPGDFERNMWRSNIVADNVSDLEYSMIKAAYDRSK